MSVKNKVAVLARGKSRMSISIARALLKDNATLIVPAKSQHELAWVKEIGKITGSGAIITLLTDLPDFYKAADLLDNVIERYGKLDMAIMCFENSAARLPLTDWNITDWERMMEQDITAFFVAVKLMYAALQQNKKGLLVMIDTTPPAGSDNRAKLAYLSLNMQNEISKIVREKAAGSNLIYHHLFVNDANGLYRVTGNSGEFTTADIGEFILRLYDNAYASEQG